MALSTTLKLRFAGQEVQIGLKKLQNSLAWMNKNSLGYAKAAIAPFAALGAVLGTTLVGGMIAFGKASSDSASELESMRSQIEVFTGSAEKTTEILGKLRELAVKSPLELKEIANGATLLLRYGIAVDDVVDATSRLSEVAGTDAERFQRLSLAFGQAASIGRLMGTEVRQFTEAGFNPLEAIAKKTGETMLQLRARMEAGNVTFGELKQSLEAATNAGGRFYGMNEKMSQTFAGRVSMMKDQWDQLLSTFGTGMNEGLKVAADAITNYLPLFKERFSTIGQYVGSAIGEAVAGDTTKLTTIGELIGEAMMVGLKAAWYSIGDDLTKWYLGMVKDLNSYVPLPGNQLLSKQAAYSLSQMPDNTGQYLDAARANSRVSELTNQIMPPQAYQSPATFNYGGEEFRRAQPGDPRTQYRDAEGNMLVKTMATSLQSIDRKLSPVP